MPYSCPGGTSDNSMEVYFRADFYVYSIFTVSLRDARKGNAMKKIRFFMILIIWLILIQPVYALTIVSINPELIDPDTAKFDIEVEMGNDEDLGGFQFDLIYNPAEVTIDSIVLGNFLGSTEKTVYELPPVFDSFKETLTFGAYTISPGVKGPVGKGTLATLTFSVKNQNDEKLSFDPNRSWIINTAGDAVPAQLKGGLITQTCKITVIPPIGGTITPPGEVIVKKGSDQTFSIIPSDCYHIVSVSVDGQSVGAVTTYTFVNVTEDHTLSADFAISTYTITPAVSGSGGNISPSTPVTVTCGQSQMFTLTPQNTSPDQCYHISGLSVDSVSVTPATAYTFDNVRSDHTISAGFALNNYILTPEAGPGGSISPSEPVILICGSQKFDIMPDTQNGYQIKDVIVDDVSIGAVNSYTFPADTLTGSNHRIKAVFVPPGFHTIQAETDGGGTISPVGAVKVGHGQNQTFEIKPADCFHIREVLADGVSQGAVSSYTFENVTADHNIRAVFEKNRYGIKIVKNEGGTVIPSEEVNAECGASQKFEIKPSDCYKISYIRLDDPVTGDDVSPDDDVAETYTIHDVRSAHTLYVEFEKLSYTVTATAEGNGTISPSGSVTVACGEAATFRIVPNDEKYPVSEVRVNGTSVGAVSEYSFENVRSDGNIIYAVFPYPYDCNFTVTVTAEKGGNVSPSGKISVECGGKSPEIKAVPDECYEFAGWKGSYTGTENPLSIQNVTENMNVTANFAVKSFTVTFKAGEHGEITDNTPQTVECNGNGTSVTAKPNQGYYFAGWSGDYTGTENPLTIQNVTKDMNIIANFAKIKLLSKAVLTLKILTGMDITSSTDIPVMDLDMNGNGKVGIEDVYILSPDN